MAILLCGCASPPDIVVACPSLRAWSPAEQKALADALEPIPESSPIWTLEKDWQRSRDETRACQKEK